MILHFFSSEPGEINCNQMKNQQILLVDDEYEQLEQIINIIEDSNIDYMLYEALDARTALYIAHREKPDLIITDWEMPKVNGLEFIKLMKKDENLKDIPVMMCTGKMTSAIDLKTALETGCVDFIRKPIDATELLARIKAMLQLFEANKKNIEQQEIIYKHEKTILEQKNQMLDNELRMKKNEMSSFLINYEKEVGKKKELIQKLEKITELPAKKINSEVKRLTNFIIQDIQKTNEEEFLNRFDGLYSGFYTNLKNKFPKLTANEMKLCSFFLLNFSTKEIATMQFQSYEAVRKARTRLRKKLGLPRDTDLCRFLLEM